MHASSPFKPTPIPKRRAVFRGGKKAGEHRRRVRTSYNPRLPHQCAYACVLKCAGMKASIKNVISLRAKVADKIDGVYWRGETVHVFRPQKSSTV